ncbi:transporter substrate-binding domain-containing protein [Escherichia coli]
MSFIKHTVKPTLLALALIGTSLSAMAAGAPIKAVTDATFPPMEFTENQKMTGFDIELVEAIGKKLDRPIQWTNVDFKGLIPSLTAGRADIAVSAIYITPEGTVAKLAMRQPFVLFKGLTFQKLCLPGAFRPGDHHNKMLRPGLCVMHASPQYL